MMPPCGTDAAAPEDRWTEAVLPDAARLQRDWLFTPSRSTLRTRLLRLGVARRARAFPAWHVLKPVTPAARWNCLFLFCPLGTLDAVQAKLVQVARALRGRLLVIAALPQGAVAPAPLAVADALVTKDLAGFDFSAYRIALALIAQHSPGALAYLQNDSVFGPLGAFDLMVEAAPWDLTGFIAGPAFENHISSFAFVVRSVTPERLAALAPAMPGDRCYDSFADVVGMQETRLARVAAREGSVGSYWYVADAPPEPSLMGAVARRVGLADRRLPPLDLRGDPALGMPLDLLDRGFPFVKRSLFGKFTGNPAANQVATRLREQGWPVREPSA